jgi:hypothetical protein
VLFNVGYARTSYRVCRPGNNTLLHDKNMYPLLCRVFQNELYYGIAILLLICPAGDGFKSLPGYQPTRRHFVSKAECN